jgi:multidrug transporter EmrE-like cation transporter
MTQLLAGMLCSSFGLAQALPQLAIGYALALAEAVATLVMSLMTIPIFSLSVSHYLSLT